MIRDELESRLQEAVTATREGRFEDAVRILQELTSVPDLSAFPELQIHGLMWLGEALAMLGRGKEAQELVDQILVLARRNTESNAHIVLADALHALGNICLRQQGYHQAMQYYEEARSINEGLNRKQPLAANLGNMGMVYSNKLGDYSSAQPLLERAVKICQEIGDSAGEGNNTCNLGTLYFHVGNYPKALLCYEHALAIDEQLGNKHSIAIDYGNIGNVHAQTGALDRALHYCSLELAIHNELHNVAERARVLTNIASLLKNLGMYNEAMGMLEEALAVHREYDNKDQIANTLSGLGDLHVDMHNYDAAIDCFNESSRIYSTLGTVSNVAALEGKLGVTLIVLNRLPEALKILHRSARMHRELGQKMQLAVAEGNIGNIYANKSFVKHSTTKAVRYYQKALAYFRSVNDLIHMYTVHKYLSDLCHSELRWKEAYEHQNAALEYEKQVKSSEARIEADKLVMRRAIEEYQQRALSERVQLERQISQQQEILTHKTLQLIQQTEMIDAIRTALQRVVRQADSAEKAITEVRKSLNSLPKQALNWQRFENDFVAVHPCFQATLKERYPTLTKTERKVCCLLRVGMKSHEIASLLFVSERTVENHRYHIKNKISPGDDRSITSLLNEI